MKNCYDNLPPETIVCLNSIRTTEGELYNLFISLEIQESSQKESRDFPPTGRFVFKVFYTH